MKEQTAEELMKISDRLTAEENKKIEKALKTLQLDDVKQALDAAYTQGHRNCLDFMVNLVKHQNRDIYDEFIASKN